MTSLDIIANRLNLSVDEVRAVLEAANSAAYTMEMNLQTWFDDYMDMELEEVFADGAEDAVFRAVNNLDETVGPGRQVSLD